MGHRRAVQGYRVLILAPYGRDAQSLADVLDRDDYQTQIVADAAELGGAMDDSTGAILLTEEAARGDIAALDLALQRQPPWSDVPLILLVTRRTGHRAEVPAPLLASGNVVTLERPLGAASLVSAVGAAMRSRQKQFEIRERVEELAESESRLRLATSAANIGTWDFDPQSGALRWDMRCKRMFGLSPDAEVTYEGSFLAGLHPEDRDHAADAVARALEPGGDGSYDIEYRTVGIEDGITRWVVARGGAVFERGRATRFIGTIIEITARKQAEAALAASEAALREESHALDTLNRVGQRLAAELDLDKLVQSVVDAGVELTGAQVGAFFYNRIDDSGESYMLYALSGVPRSAFEGFPMPRNTAIFGPTFAGNDVVRSDDITRDPRYGHNMPYRGMPEGHLKIVSYLAVPVMLRSGKVIGGLFFGHPEPAMFDKRAERLARGISAQAAIAIDNARLLQATQQMNQRLEEMVAERTAALETEAANRAQAEAALRQSQKMEAVGQLTGGIAHDFNNMLTGVIGALDIIKRRIAAGRIDDLDRFMDAASTSAQRAAALTARLLAFSRRQSLDSKPIDVNALVEGLRDLLARSVNEDTTLNLALAEDLPAAVADAHQLESAILNLVINARDAMPEGGTLTVETRFTEVDQAFAAARPEFTPGRYIVVAVSDTGVGIPPELAEKVFEPFFTTKPIGQGTGLGLSMVYGFARQSGGHARLHSRAGEGTSVTLYLPVAEGVFARPEPEAQIPTREGGGETVLVVEDDPSVRLLIHDVLEDLGYRVVEAAEAQAAIAILRRPDPIQLMVSDVGLPGINGRQLADLARAERPDLPILFVTGYAENAAIRAGFLGTNMTMITKPFALDTLAAKVSEMVMRGEPQA